MDSKIQELAEKIYKDGVEKASVEASKIEASAEQKREQILKQATEEATAIVAKAKAEQARIAEQTDREVRVAVENATSSLQSAIASMVAGEAVKAGVDEALSKPETLQAVVAKMSEQMFKEEANGVVISTADAAALEAYFQKHTQQLLGKGVTIKEVAGRPAHFELSPQGGGYKLVVSNEAFKEYFKEFLTPRLRAKLFKEAE